VGVAGEEAAAVALQKAGSRTSAPSLPLAWMSDCNPLSYGHAFRNTRSATCIRTDYGRAACVPLAGRIIKILVVLVVSEDLPLRQVSLFILRIS
jgi:hypothetical protein